MLEPLTYIRGRCLPHLFIIVDEAQNLTPHEVKTIVSRVGEGTKVILTGDIYQIDNPYLDQSSNGLSYVVERMKGQALRGHVTLAKSERQSWRGWRRSCCKHRRDDRGRGPSREPSPKN